MAEKKITYLENDNVIINSKKYSRADIYDLYITQNHSILELCEIIGLKKSAISNVLKKLHLSKTSEAGVNSYFQTDSFKEKSKKTCLEKYGVEHSSQSQEVKNKTKQTCLNRYGVEYTTQTDVMKSKSKQTMLLHYGVEHALQNSEIQSKMQNHVYEKFGTRTVLQNSQVINKIAQTNLKKYGVKNPFANKDIQNKIHETNLKKYGTQSFKQRSIKNIDIWSNETNFINFINSLCEQEKTNIKYLCDFFNCESTALYKKIHNYNLDDKIKWYTSRSYYEDEIISWLQEEIPNIKIETNVRNILSNKSEIDIYLPEYKIGIEFNGSYWHSDVFEKFQDHGGRSLYHQNKSLEAEKSGIFLFHIFEYEWNNTIVQENIKNRLRTLLCKNNNIIYARKCKIQTITKEEKKIFLDNYHIQGNDHSAIYLGLYYQNELVSCMTFTLSKYKKYNYELSRFCSIHNTNVVGGASKMFKYFVDNYLNLGETVVSYNDITKTSGKIYKILGFTNSSINSPNYVWINFDTGDVRSRYQEQKSGEVERMHSQNYHRICDCGTKTWIYTKK